MGNTASQHTHILGSFSQQALGTSLWAGMSAMVEASGRLRVVREHRAGSNQRRPGLWGKVSLKRGNIRADKLRKIYWAQGQILRAQKRASARHDHRRWWWLLRTPGGLEWWVWREKQAEPGSLSKSWKMAEIISNWNDLGNAFWDF